MEIDTQNIYEELKGIRENIEYIKKNMIDTDMFLTHEESKKVRESVAEYSKGKKLTLKQFEKNLKNV
jgi:uncharacterized lipoprotein YehR (DUF1307 family)